MSEQPAQKRVTAADIARSLGISRATVGFVLNDTPGQTIPPKTQERVRAEAARLGYRPHLAARALASGQSKIVLLVLPEWPIEHSMRTHLDEASLALDEAGYSLVTMTHHQGGQARPLWETLQPDLVMGMMPFTEAQLREIRATGTRVIDPGTPDGSAESLEFELGPVLQIEHLAERGHEHVLFASTTDPRLERLAAERERLARDSARRLGLNLRVLAVDESTVHTVIADVEAAGITAIATYNDDIAAAIVAAAVRSGILIPEQLAIIGHDDAPIARWLVPSLSTIHVDNAGLGRYFAALALHTIEGAPAPEAGPVTRATLVIRETT